MFRALPLPLPAIAHLRCPGPRVRPRIESDPSVRSRSRTTSLRRRPLASLAPTARRAAITEQHGLAAPDDTSFARDLEARFDAGTAPASLRLTLAAARWLAKAAARSAGMDPPHGARDWWRWTTDD